MACLFYTGITEYLIKRRDVYKHYKKRDTDNYNNNNININISNESKKDNKDNKKNIIDDIQDFYFDEEQFEIHSKINKERNLKNNINDFNYDGAGAGYSKRSTRNKDVNIYKEIDMNVNISVSGKTNITPKVK